MIFMIICMVIGLVLYHVDVFTRAGAVAFVGIEFMLMVWVRIGFPIMRVAMKTKRVIKILESIDDLDNMTEEEANRLEMAAKELQLVSQEMGIRATTAEDILETINSGKERRMKESGGEDV